VSWQRALVGLFGLAVIFAALYLVLDEIRQRRRDAKAFRINPMYRVGADAKDFP
jgi:hypothetical protein